MKKLYILIILSIFSSEAFAQLPSMSVGGSIGGLNDDNINAMTTDGQGNVYVVGSFTGTTDFEQFGSTTNANGHGITNSDGYVAKYNSSGTLQWVNVIGSTDVDFAGGVAADANGVYVTGFFRLTVDFDPTSGTSNKTSNGGTSDVFIVKYNPSNGNLIWVNTFGSNDADYGAAITLDASSNVYVAGAFRNTINPDPAGLATNIKTSNGDYDIFIAKYGSSGEFFWSHKIGSSAEDAPNAIQVSGTSLFIAAYYEGQLFVDQSSSAQYITNLGNADGYLGQYNIATGAFVWGGSIRSSGDDTITSLVVDGDQLYSAGYFTATASMYGENSSGLSVTSAGLTDGFVANHNVTSHDLYWIQSFGGTNYDTVNGMCEDGNLFVVGAFSGTADLDPSSSTQSFVSAGSYDAFMLKLTQDNGSYVAAAKVGGTGTDKAISIINANGGTVWGGMYQSTVDIDPGTPVTSKTSAGGYDIFLGNFTPVEPTVSAGALQFPNTHDETYEVKYQAAPHADGYLVLRSKTATPTFVPVDGTTYASGFTSGNDGVLYAGPADWITANSLASTTYYHAVYAYNGSGTKTNYKTTSPATGSVTTTSGGDDLTPPVVVDNSPKTTFLNTDIPLSVKVTDAGSGVSSVSVTYYPITTSDKGEGDMTLKAGTTDTYEFTIPKSFIKEQGVEYYITAYDYDDNEQQTSYRSIIIQYTGNGFLIDHNQGTDQTDYTLIAIPLDLTNKKVNDVFDELGSYDKTKYRLFRFANNNNIELSGADNIAAGQAYWFISADSKSIYSGPGNTIDVGYQNAFTVPIHQGWNLVGNPFNKVVSWTNIQDADGNQDMSLTKFKTFENGGFINGANLSVERGAFIWADDPGDGALEIPVYIDDSGRQGTPSVDFAQTIDSNVWGVDFVVTSGTQKNTFAGFGMHPEAKDLNDRFDDYTLPRFMDYLELNYNKKVFGASFTKDIVPTSTQHVWEFQVASNLTDNVIVLSWDNTYFGASSLQLVLWDVDQQRAIDMKSHTQYSFERGKSNNFKVFYGSDSYVKTETLPYIPVFHSASPVPTSGNVTFAFSVPESDGQVNTNLSIYNSLGQKIAKLVDQPLAGGYQQAIWNIEDGSKPAAGVYISVLKFGESTLQKRIIIK